jgi:4Fe-4S binding protein
MNSTSAPPKVKTSVINTDNIMPNKGGRPPFIKAIEAFFVRHKSKLLWVHIVMFVVFLALLFLPLFLSEPAEDATPLTHFTVLANYLMWGLWFPLVFISVIFTGRSWCGLLCPMGAASEWANKKGPQWRIPAWIRWEGTPIVSFLVITILGQTVGVRDHPEAIAEVFGGILLFAILIGFFYGRNKRAWCRHVCPIGLLLGVYSRLGAIQFRPKIKRAGGDKYTENGICPTMIDISKKEESRHCIECFRCVNPKAKGGLDLVLRTPGTEIKNIRDYNPNMAEIWFLFLGTGAALGGFLWLVLPLYGTLRQQVGEWFINQGWYWIAESGPWWLMSVHPERREVFFWLDFFMISGTMITCTILLAGVLYLSTKLSAWLSGRVGGDQTGKQRFTELGYQYAPVAMVSLILGLGGELFEPLRTFGLDSQQVAFVKASLFVPAIAWSVYLGDRILSRQGLKKNVRWIPLLPGIAGSLMVAFAWWPALFSG